MPHADDTPTLVLLSGVPGTGKSTFGRWAEREHGVVHIDVEQGGFDRFGLISAWRAICLLPPPDVMSFVRELQRLGQPVLVDWGFPPAVLPLVRALHDAGLRAWWFDGDRAAARNAFIHRDTVSLRALDSATGPARPTAISRTLRFLKRPSRHCGRRGPDRTGAGSGPTPRHAYAKPGTYKVIAVLFSGIGSAFPGAGAAPVLMRAIKRRFRWLGSGGDRSIAGRRR